MTELICIHCFISGKVQGVWFRAGTKNQADQLGVKGWARNLPDGRVEVLACGSREKIAVLKTWLQHGPPLAKVTDFFCQEWPWQDHEEFIV